MTLKKVINPLEVIAQRGGGVQNCKERILRAYFECNHADFKAVVKKEYYQAGWGSPIDEDKPFPQVKGSDYFRKNIEVTVAIKRKDETIYTEKYEYSLEELCEEIIKLIETDKYEV